MVCTLNNFSYDAIYNFINGIYGFEEHKQFAFINQSNDINNPFRLMVSVNNPDISFIVVPPTFVHENYEIKIDDTSLNNLAIKDTKDIMVFCIVSLSKDNIYINLKSPIVLSIKNKFGEQIILDNSSYKIRHVIANS